MARAARVVAEGVPHHITQRGNNRQNIFLLDEDRRFCIEALRARFWQYGLMIGQGIGVGWDLERERERGLPSTPLLLLLEVAIWVQVSCVLGPKAAPCSADAATTT